RPAGRDGAPTARPRRRQARDPPRLIAAAWTCLFLPLLAALLITVRGNTITRRGAGFLATLAVFGSFASAVVVFAKMLSLSPDARAQTSTAWTWLTSGNLRFGLQILVDPVSALMMLIVSGVGALIVMYSIGY